MSKEKVVRKPVEKIKPGQFVVCVITILLAILFLYPVFFGLPVFCLLTIRQCATSPSTRNA